MLPVRSDLLQDFQKPKPNNGPSQSALRRIRTHRTINVVLGVAVTLVLLVPPGLYLGFWIQYLKIRPNEPWSPWLLWIIPYLVAVAFLFTKRIWPVTLLLTCILSVLGFCMLMTLGGV